eukprot:9452350-Alexandrium_andersonii.AAC.1
MSASLVGSEMCIRDRQNTVPVTRHSARYMHGVAKPSGGGGEGAGVGTVSYTHLTLPTICSV